MKPYYDRKGITIYHGDCREVMPTLPKVDLVLTDPPYGIGPVWNGGKGHGWSRTDSQKGERILWDRSVVELDVIRLATDKAPVSIVWGGNHYALSPSRCWLIWNKPERGFTLAEAELAWTNADNVTRVFDCHRSDSGRQHPTQKPVALMAWCLSLSWSKECGTILDPFMGSGTTLRAAKDLGRKAIGIEIEEKYCEIAAKRMGQEMLV